MRIRIVASLLGVWLLAYFTDEMLNPRGGKNLLLVDACRDDVIDRHRSGRTRGIQERVVALPENTAILFSSQAGQKAEGCDALKHSVLTHDVIETLRASTDDLTCMAFVDGAKNCVAAQIADQEPVPAEQMLQLVLGRRTMSPSTIPIAVTTKSLALPGPGRAAVRSGAGEEREDNGLKLKLCWCPKKSVPFRMGSPVSELERRDDEGPVDVTLTRGYWMGKYEVTQGQWKVVMGTTIEEQRVKAGLSGLYGEGPDHPMYYVDPVEAEEFCRLFTECERRAGRLPLGWEYQLPTEAQWENACRAGTTMATVFGSRLSSVDANFDGTYPYNGAAMGPMLERTTAVGSYRPNAWGLCDMHGNVWEWCRDAYAKELPGGTDPFQTPAMASDRVLRGGGWLYDGCQCRSALRCRMEPGYRHGSIGFRVARVPSR